MIIRFLVSETFITPPTKEVLELIPAEQARVKELTEQGLLEAIYVGADRVHVWMIWNCESQAQLEDLHKTLPLHDYLHSDSALLADRA
jgi:muconolactone delta-isomerase